LRVFDAIEGDVLISPDRATSAVHNGMVTWTDITREGQVFSIFDPPAGLDPLAMAAYVVTTASLVNLTENAAIYYPRIQITNPATEVYGSVERLTVPPSGHLAGIYARTEASIPVGGQFIQPAGTDVGPPLGMIGWEGDVDQAVHPVLIKANRETLFPLNVNLISREIKGSTSTGIFVDGARNLDITGSWPSVGQRRGAMFVEKRLQPGLAFIRHRNNKADLRSEAKRTVVQFLTQIAGSGELASIVPAEAFFVDFGGGLNTASVKAARTVRGSIGLATNEPAEFVNIDIGPFDGALEAELAAISEGGA
jgi:phage tail sheath protein FI